MVPEGREFEEESNGQGEKTGEKIGIA